MMGRDMTSPRPTGSKPQAGPHQNASRDGSRPIGTMGLLPTYVRIQ